jgi:hypothetical protein
LLHLNVAIAGIKSGKFWYFARLFVSLHPKEIKLGCYDGQETGERRGAPERGALVETV